jgi:hypothetical protein
LRSGKGLIAAVRDLTLCIVLATRIKLEQRIELPEPKPGQVFTPVYEPITPAALSQHAAFGVLAMTATTLSSLSGGEARLWWRPDAVISIMNATSFVAWLPAGTRRLLKAWAASWERARVSISLPRFSWSFTASAKGRGGEGACAKLPVRPGLLGSAGLGRRRHCDPGHLLLGTALVRVVGEGEPGHGASNRTSVSVGRHAEGLVPAELGLLEQDLNGLGRGVLHEYGEYSGPGRHGRPAAAPVVDLTGGIATGAGEGGLTDVGAGQQGGEFGA